MSLVNDMLRDLDRRRRHPVGYPSARMALDGDGVIGGNNRKLLIIAGMTLLVVLVAVAWVIGRSVPQSAPQAVVGADDSPLVQRGTSDVAGANAADEAAQPAISARIAGERNRSNGFELRLEASAEVAFEVLTRTDRSVSVLLQGVTALSNRITSIDGAGAEITENGLLVSFDMARDTDFVVYENSNAFTFAVVIEGFWQGMPEMTSAPDSENVSAQAAVAVADTGVPEPAGAQLPSADARSGTPRPEDNTAAPVRTQRQLSLQEQDRNASQLALRQAQSGQMQSAFTSLYEFIAKNPEAHQSRNTLITLLYAQQQYDQVGLLVEEGLSLAPNLSLYKKMKARLLMMQGQYQQAVTLLRNVPPAVSEDKEYHELLASLYQQTGEFSAAIATYQDLIRTDNTVGRWWAGMGISHESLGNTREAVSSFEVALQIPGLENNLRQYSRNRIQSLSGQ